MIYLDPEQHRALRKEAASQGISMAELLRRVVRRHLDGRGMSVTVPPDAYLKIVALGSSDHTDVSERHDSYLAEALTREHSR